MLVFHIWRRLGRGVHGGEEGLCTRRVQDVNAPIAVLELPQGCRFAAMRASHPKRREAYVFWGCVRWVHGSSLRTAGNGGGKAVHAFGRTGSLQHTIAFLGLLACPLSIECYRTTLRSRDRGTLCSDRDHRPAVRQPDEAQLVDPG